MGKDRLEDISKITGYSKSTISRVLNGKSDIYRISCSAKDTILKVADELNYKPNLIAQSLRNNVTKTVGLLVPHIDNPFFANIASIVICEAQKQNYTVMLIDTLEDPGQEAKALRSLMARNIDGIMVVPCGENTEELRNIAKQVPIVFIDRYYKNIDLPYVSTNNYDGAYKGTKLLLESGHRKILCIQGPEMYITTKERVRGYTDAMTEYGNAANISLKGNEFSIRNGYIETKMAIDSPDRPTAIFALSSTILLGAVKVLNEHHILIPDDISIISFDDNLYMDYLNPPITRIAQPLTNIGIIAFKILMDIILNNSESNSQMLLNPTLIKRESVKTIL